MLNVDARWARGRESAQEHVKVQVRAVHNLDKTQGLSECGERESGPKLSPSPSVRAKWQPKDQR